ncbi:MAG: hypothetical protein M1828_002257 [Chrysothrix sp. TS-e1954]|nr:MAG: hypothetical protein M1828_002257 [Chrysothrix sp. TS-e1954]
MTTYKLPAEYLQTLARPHSAEGNIAQDVRLLLLGFYDASGNIQCWEGRQPAHGGSENYIDATCLIAPQHISHINTISFPYFPEGSRMLYNNLLIVASQVLELRTEAEKTRQLAIRIFLNLPIGASLLRWQVHETPTELGPWEAAILDTLTCMHESMKSRDESARDESIEVEEESPPAGSGPVLPAPTSDINITFQNGAKLKYKCANRRKPMYVHDMHEDARGDMSHFRRTMYVSDDEMYRI